jgi:hypothetical protein
LDELLSGHADKIRVDMNTVDGSFKVYDNGRGIPFDEKLELLRKSNPKHSSAFKAASKESPTLFHHAAALHKAGYHHLHVVVGADRVEEFKTNLNKYNGKDYHFKSIKVSSAGDRDTDAEGAEGMSASKMRAHALSGNKTEFLKGLHPALHSHADELMKKIKDRIK